MASTIPVQLPIDSIVKPAENWLRCAVAIYSNMVKIQENI